MQAIAPAAIPEEIVISKRSFDFKPLLLLPAAALLGLVLVRDPGTWVLLTIAGIGMGFIYFLAASGLTLVFGLMGVMNFGHGIFITCGALFGGFLFRPSVSTLLSCWFRIDSLPINLLAIAIAAIIAMTATALVALVFERLVVRYAYGKPLATQIMLTIAGMIVAEQLLQMLIGRGTRLARPPSLSGPFMLGDIPVEKYRLLGLVVGLAVFILITLVLKRTKIGLLVRAAVQEREMVEAMGYKVKYLFVGVFMAGAALAALGGLIYGIFQTSVGIKFGDSMMAPIFMILIIGGLGSVTGACVAAILIGLLMNYIGFVLPVMTAWVTILVVLLTLMWRPQGLYPVDAR